MEHFTIRNWRKYQHYTNRNPSWIKLHVELLNSRDWVMLSDKNRVLLIACMLLASKNNGKIPNDEEYIKRVCYLKEVDLKPLIDIGFLECASSCKQLRQNAIQEVDLRLDKEVDLREEEEQSPVTVSSPKDDAEKIVKYYEQEVRDDRASRYRARKNVLALLKGGAKKEVLWECVNLYASEVDPKATEYRKVSGNFFGRDAVYLNYIDEAKRIVEVAYAAKG